MPGPIVDQEFTSPKVESRNKVVIDSLVSTFQHNLDKAKVYDCIRRMAGDLTKTYEALFGGPLPAVDGFDLTRLNAAVLEGVLPEEYNLAYIDVNNQFERGQTIIYDDAEEPFLLLGFGNIPDEVDPSSYFRIGALADGEFYISQNQFWDGAAWDVDDGAVGSSRIDFIDGLIDIWLDEQITFHWFDAGLVDYRRTFQFDVKVLKLANDADDAFLGVLELDSNDVIRLGLDAETDNTVEGHIAIPFMTAAQLPTAGADANGIVVIDTTNNRFCFYLGGNRYYVLGTAF